MVLATSWRRPAGSRASAAPRMARLSLSVPPLVNTTSDGSALMSSATRLRASSMTALAFCPKWWTLEGLPYSSRRAAAMASTQAAATGVVALWSK